MARTLIPDYIGTTGLPLVRALGRARHECDVAWPYRRTRRLIRSRFIGRLHHVDPPTTHPEAYGQQVLELCRIHRHDVLIPLSLDAVVALLPLHEQLSQVTSCLLPPARGLKTGNDKLETFRLCQELGIPTPRTIPLSGKDDLNNAAKDLGYPLVLKPRENFGGARGVRVVGDAAELSAAYHAAVEACGGEAPILLQEFIPGYTHDACAIAAHGEVTQIVTQVRKLMYPAGGGVGAIVFTTHNPCVEDLALRFLESLTWNGPAQIEFRLDKRDGQLKLIELNPRFWGTLDASIRAGIDFPSIYCDLALGRPIVRHQPYEEGVRYSYLFSRTCLAYRELIRHHGLKGLRDPQTYLHRYVDFDLTDPLPDLYKILLTFRRLLRTSGAARDRSPRSVINPLNCVLPDSYARPTAPLPTTGPRQS